MKVTNTSPAPQGVNTKGGVVFLRPDQTKNIDFTDEGLKQARRLPFLKIDGKAAVDPGGDEEKSGAGPKAVHRGRGSYSVVDGDAELVEGLTKEEAEAFNSATDEAKAAFVVERKKPNE